MKTSLFFVLVMLLIFIITGYASELIESYKLNNQEVTNEITLGDFSITAYGNRFSISEWWLDQPTVTLEYEGEASFLSEIETSLQELGFVLGKGKRMYIKTERIQDRFLYIETTYDSKEKNNKDSLMVLTEDNKSQLQTFFFDAYGDYHDNLPKLMLIHTDRFFKVNGDILYKGPDYSIVQTFEEKLIITDENRITEFDIPFYPILFLDLTQSQYLLTVETQQQQQIFIDGKKYNAPLQLYLSEGVHELEHANKSQYIYLNQDMVISLDAIKKAELNLNLNVFALVRIFKEGQLIESIETQNEQVTLVPGKYQLVVEKTGYRPYEEAIALSSNQQLIKEIELIEIPGTVVYRMKLSDSYNNILFEGRQVILTNLEKSILIDIETEQIKGIHSKVVWFDGDIVVAGNKITDTDFNMLFSSPGVIINAVKTQGSLWLFTSDKKCISVDVNKWVRQWTRTVDYLAFEIVSSDTNICILDPYSRVILINSELGYRDYFDLRLPGVTGIQLLEETKERIRVNLLGYNGYVDYYLKSRSSDLRKGDLEPLKNEFEQLADMLYQNGNPLISLSGSVIKVVKKQNHLAILTDEEMVVCTSY